MDYFNEILHSLVVADNAVRGEAEQRYEILTKGDDCVLLPQALLQFISDPLMAFHIRQLAAVLLRRMLIEDYNGIYRKMTLER
jgi:hypothetical protein